MRPFLTCMAALLLFSAASAQSADNLYKVKPGETVMYSLPFNVRYVYPEFRNAVVQFRNGKAGGGQMNYSNLLQEMEFISASDTLALDDIESVKYIVFDKDTFFRAQKYFVRQIALNGENRLCEKTALNLANRERYGGHGEVQQGSSVQAIEQLSSELNTMRRMVSKEQMTFSYDRTYYFGDRFGNLKIANKKNLLDMFGKNYPGLENFIAQNKVNFSKADDMKLVLEFLSIDEQRRK